MSKNENQFELPFNDDIVEDNKSLEKESLMEKIRDMADLENGRLESFVSFLNRVHFDLGKKHEDLRKIVLDAFGGRNPFKKDQEEVFPDYENTIAQNELERLKEKAKLNKNIPIISSMDAYEREERKKEAE